ncbi:unnamed protein product [Jaminaea pallidilutea]
MPSLPAGETIASGGFFAPPVDSIASSTRGSTSRTGAGFGGADDRSDAKPALRLSPSQLTRLRTHLDDSILSINRRYAKRHQSREGSAGREGNGYAVPEAGPSSSSSAPLYALDGFLNAWSVDVVPLLARIDPVGAQQTTMLVAYAMRLVDTLCNGITGYDVATASTAEDGEQHASDRDTQRSHTTSMQIYSLFHLLHLLDALWAALLVGRRFDLGLATTRATARVSSLKRSGSDVDESLQGQRTMRDSVSVQGSMGTRTTTMTDRVRLRNLLLERKRAIQTWLSDQIGGTFAIQPSEAASAAEEVHLSGFMPASSHRSSGNKRRRTGEASTHGQQRGEAGVRLDGIEERGDSDENDEEAVNDQRDDDEEADLEEVQVPGGGERNGTAAVSNPGEEYRGDEHYTKLFEKKLNPDEGDDTDEEDHDENDDNSSDGGQVNGGIKAEEAEEDDAATVRDDVPSDRKRLRVSPPQDASSTRNATAVPQSSDGRTVSSSDPAAPGSSIGLNSLELEAEASKIFSRSLAILERLLE